ncbi:MAG: membrane protein insertion efficiency factor YidD [Candidatus Korobacteraceae bacterium]
MKFLLLSAIRLYRWLFSPLLPQACRYLPTCSEYALEAVEHHGVLRGGIKAVGRVLRCHPLAVGGYDPVKKNVPHGAKTTTHHNAQFASSALLPDERY